MDHFSGQDCFDVAVECPVGHLKSSALNPLLLEDDGLHESKGPRKKSKKLKKDGKEEGRLDNFFLVPTNDSNECPDEVLHCLNQNYEINTNLECPCPLLSSTNDYGMRRWNYQAVRVNADSFIGISFCRVKKFFRITDHECKDEICGALSLMEPLMLKRLKREAARISESMPNDEGHYEQAIGWIYRVACFQSRAAKDTAIRQKIKRMRLLHSQNYYSYLMTCLAIFDGQEIDSQYSNLIFEVESCVTDMTYRMFEARGKTFLNLVDRLLHGNTLKWLNKPQGLMLLGAIFYHMRLDH